MTDCSCSSSRAHGCIASLLFLLFNTRVLTSHSVMAVVCMHSARAIWRFCFSLPLPSSPLGLVFVVSCFSCCQSQPISCQSGHLFFSRAFCDFSQPSHTLLSPHFHLQNALSYIEPYAVDSSCIVDCPSFLFADREHPSSSRDPSAHA